MKLLTFHNESKGVHVVYKTDLIAENQTNFTVMTIEGLDEAEQLLGIDFKQLPYNLDTFIAFAKEHKFGLTLQTLGSFELPPPVVLVPEVPEESEDEGSEEPAP